MNSTIVSPEQMIALRDARDKLKNLAEESDRFDYIDTGDALDAMGDAYDAIDALLTPIKDRQPIVPPMSDKALA